MGAKYQRIYRNGYEHGRDVRREILAEGGDPSDARDPLSGEFAGESMREVLGDDADDEYAADVYEEGYWDGVMGHKMDVI